VSIVILFTGIRFRKLYLWISKKKNDHKFYPKFIFDWFNFWLAVTQGLDI